MIEGHPTLSRYISLRWYMVIIWGGALLALLMHMLIRIRASSDIAVWQVLGSGYLVYSMVNALQLSYNRTVGRNYFHLFCFMIPSAGILIIVIAGCAYRERYIEAISFATATVVLSIGLVPSLFHEYRIYSMSKAEKSTDKPSI